MGNDPSTLGAQRALPGPRREEPLRGRRRAVRFPGRQESDLDHPGALDADVDFIASSKAETWMRNAETQRRRRGRVSSSATLVSAFTRRCTMSDLTRRARSDPPAFRAGCGPLRRRWCAGGGGARARESGIRTRPSSSPPMNTRRSWCWWTSSSRATNASGSATDAGVPEFIDYIIVGPEGTADADSRRAGLARQRVPGAIRQDFPGRRRRPAPGGARRHRLAGEGPAGISQGVAFFNDFRDLTASGFFSSRMGVNDLQYLGNTVVPEWKGCPPRRSSLGSSMDRGDGGMG